MKFHGLFVGIDSYASDFVRLKFAIRDAVVLGALFEDNLGGGCTVLLGDGATKEEFVAEMERLAQVSTEEDLVVVTFSGHGVTGGALAMYDTERERTAETSVPLDEFARLAQRIRSRALLVVLDCCFAGHAADKLLRLPADGYVSRDGAVSAMSGLHSLYAAGHIVIAASGRDQRAFEVPGFRHGLLSYYLIQGLLGAPGAVEDGRIYLLKLAHYVIKSVSSHKIEPFLPNQEPVLGGSVSNLSLELFRPGPRYVATADGTRPEPANADLSSLAAYGIPGSVLDVWRGRVGKLNQLQVDAVNEGALLEGINVLVVAPTSTGKTMVGEMAAMRAVAEGGKAVFLLPSRALVNEQYENFRALYGSLGIRVVRATGELRDQIFDLVSNQYELAVLTYEKFIGLLLKKPELLDVRVLVVDEIQSLFLPGRGPLLEIMLTWLRMRSDSIGKTQLVGLSAVLGEPGELARWLRASLVTGARRGVPLLEGVIGPDGRYRYRDQQGTEGSDQLLEARTLPETDDDALAVELLRRLVGEGEQVIVFRAKRAQACTLAGRLARTLGLPAATRTLAALPGGDEGQITDMLRACLKGGVAFHMTDLTLAERRLLELSFGSEVRVLVATTTLAQGVNLPADTVVVCELEHPSSSGLPYSVAEYKNMAGRAGRTGLVDRGRTMVLARGTTDADQKWQRYVQGEPEEPRSVLLLSAADAPAVILAALAGPVAANRRCTQRDVEGFLAATFAAHQATADGSVAPLPTADVRSLVSRLIATGFITRTPPGPEELPSELVLTELGRLAIQSGLGVGSVSAVAEALAAVPAEQVDRATLVCAAQLTAELDDLRFRWLPQQHNRERGRMAEGLRKRGVADPVLHRLMGVSSRDGIGIGHARRSIACLMWTEGIRVADIERVIGDSRRRTRSAVPGPVQQTVRRAADVIGTVIDIAAHLHPSADLDDLADTLPIQLELGIVAGLVPIARHAQADLVRSVYIDLARAGLVSYADILAAAPDDLLASLGGNRKRERIVREAAQAAQAEADETDLRDLLMSQS